MVTKMENTHKKIECPVLATLELIGGRWKTLILFHLSASTRRFGEIAARIPHVSRKVLTEQLKELERDGLILRTAYREVPPRVEYSLTDLGRSLSPVIKAIEDWGKEHVLSEQ
jgi:DNA-binding HxlR family transcriptional regulator